MSDTSTIQIIDSYLEEASAPMFLSGFFQSPARNFHTTEDVEMDIQRDDEKVAIAITDLTVGPRSNEATVYTNKRFKPPIFDEMGAISAFDLQKRLPGQNPFSNPDYAANAVRQAFDVYRKCEMKIRRAVELMASQVLQTGTLTLINSAGATLYTLDFQQKATHRAAAAVVWAADGSTGNPLADLSALATILRRDGKKQPNKLIFGDTAFTRFFRNAQVLTALDSRRMQTAEVAPQPRGEGATFQGWVWIGHYRFEMWTYDGFFRHPQTDAFTSYVGAENVIMMSDGARLDLTFGAIPLVMPPDPRLAAFLPSRIASSGRGIDLSTNAWITPDNKAVMVSAGTRPLTIPTAIDTFGVLDITP